MPSLTSIPDNSRYTTIVSFLLRGSFLLLFWGCLPPESPWAIAEPPLSEKGPWMGPVDLCTLPGRDTLLMLTAETPALWKWSPSGEQFLKLEKTPHRLAMLPGKATLAVTCGESRGELLLIDLEELSIRKRIRVGHTPCDVTIGSRNDRPIAWVGNRFDGTVSRVDLRSGKCLAPFPVAREPIAVALSPEGERLMIAHHLPDMSADGDDIAAGVWTRDLATGKVRVARLMPGGMNVRDLVIEPRGQIAIATHLEGNFAHLPTHADAGWINENVLSVFDAETGSFHASIALDSLGYGAGNPWGLACSDDGQTLAVAHAGSCEITLLDLDRLRTPFLEEADRTASRPDTDRPLSIRIPLPIQGLRRVAWSQDALWACGYFDDTLARLRFATSPAGADAGIEKDRPVGFVIPKRWKKETLPPFEQEGIRVKREIFHLQPESSWGEVRRGAMLFHDATHALEAWHSCASCHPDGRSDALNWDLLNDGMNNPKNTKSLLLSHRTPPSMASGVRPSAEAAVRAGMAHILFSDFSEADARSIDAYLRSLEPVRSPFLDTEGDSAAAVRRGRLLFERPDVGCARCHPSPLFTDRKQHDVGTSGPRDQRIRFDTPTLVEVWRTAPYLHDGRFATLRELLFDGKHGNRSGGLDRLTESEREDLLRYVLSL